MMCSFLYCVFFVYVFFFKQKTAYEMRISDWSSDVCSSDLQHQGRPFFVFAHDLPRRLWAETLELHCDDMCRMQSNRIQTSGLASMRTNASHGHSTLTSRYRIFNGIWSSNCWYWTDRKSFVMGMRGSVR